MDAIANLWQRAADNGLIGAIAFETPNQSSGFSASENGPVMIEVNVLYHSVFELASGERRWRARNGDYSHVDHHFPEADFWGVIHLLHLRVLRLACFRMGMSESAYLVNTVLKRVLPVLSQSCGLRDQGGLAFIEA